LRYDVGFSAGRSGIVEGLVGIGTYAAALPFLAAGVIVTLVLTAIAKRHGQPDQIVGHPLTPFILESGWWGRLEALLVASVVAPIVEETMFRGVLYRHLRESTAGNGRIVSAGLSALAVSFVFAVIHPQGWLGVPPLMGLAFAFCLAREWRNSLVAPMVAHAIQNGAILTFVVLSVG
jgi:membrane protease YdiL (CAAX protease family)